jgi:hypothetical protein
LQKIFMLYFSFISSANCPVFADELLRLQAAK